MSAQAAETEQNGGLLGNSPGLVAAHAPVPAGKQASFVVSTLSLSTMSIKPDSWAAVWIKPDSWAAVWIKHLCKVRTLYQSALDEQDALN